MKIFLKSFLVIAIAAIIFLTGSQTLKCLAKNLASESVLQHSYQVSGSSILRDGEPAVFKGVNAMHVFNLDDPGLQGWTGINIIREFVGDLENTPLSSGQTFRDPRHNWTLRAIQDMVDANRKRGMVTIICPMGWDANKTNEFSGCVPTQASWYANYKQRMRQWVAQVKGQSDVWIEVMNEPFHQCKTPEDESLWLLTMQDMVDNLRSAGWDGIILVPGSGWGQEESVVEKKGPQLLHGRQNLLFDVHIYDGWLKHPETIYSRYEKMRDSKLPFVFAELGPGAHSDFVCDARPFIKLAEEKGLSLLAWGWGTWGDRHPINLQNNDGSPNDNGNYNWGSSFKSYLGAPVNRLPNQEISMPQAPVSSVQEKAPLVVLVEAENAKEFHGCKISSQPIAFTGSGTLHFDSQHGEANWVVEAPATGRYLVALKYCMTGDSDEVAAIVANNGPVHSVRLKPIPASYGSAQTWYPEFANQNWKFVGTPIDLQAGSNKISVAAQTASGGLTLDNISFVACKRGLPVAPYFEPKTYGARGDGVTLDTASLQRCIDKCQGTGGTVVITGGNYLTGALHLKSNMTLWIDTSARLLGSTNLNDYNSLPGRREALLEGENVSDIVITGGGIVDGQGDSSVWAGKVEKDRSSLLHIANGRNILVTNLDFNRGAFWGVVFDSCDNVDVNAINVVSLSHPNRDGLDVCDCHQIEISNSSFLSDDDALCLKSLTCRGVGHLFAKNLALSTGANGIKFGSDSYGEFNYCRFEDITITRSGTAISIGIADGGEVSHATFRNMRMGSVYVPLNILQGAGLRKGWTHVQRPSKELGNAGRVHDILLENIQASTRHQLASCVSGVQSNNDVYRVENVILRGVTVENGEGFGGNSAPAQPKEYAGEYPDYGWMGYQQLPSSGLYVRHAKNVKVENCQFSSFKPDSRGAVHFDDVLP